MRGEATLVSRLQAGDEAAFAELVDRHHLELLRLASTFVPNQAVAEEVVQETWIAVVRGIERFEGRSSLRTWLYRIVANRARTIGARERRQVPVDLTEERAVPASRFDAAGEWRDPPARWSEDVESRLDAALLAAHVRACIDSLPAAQRQVVVLRDVDGLSAAEVCDVLGMTDGNQRVLLHRGRAAVRRMLAAAMGEGES